MEGPGRSQIWRLENHQPEWACPGLFFPAIRPRVGGGIFQSIYRKAKQNSLILTGGWNMNKYARWLCRMVALPIFLLAALVVHAAEDPVGAWHYQKGGFGDDITLARDNTASSALDPGTTGDWHMEGDVLLVRWKNGWTNQYRIGPGPGPFSGVDIDAQGESHAGGSFSRLVNAPPAQPCFNEVSRPVGDGMVEYAISNNDCGTQRLTMPGHRYCALNWVASGGFNSSCQIKKSGRDWILENIDPPPPDGIFIGQGQICAAICY